MKIEAGLHDPDQLNHAQYDGAKPGGLYESFYQRANHPTRPLAFWIRYTVFAPKDRPEATIGELWFVFFDGETGEHVVMKEEFPIAECAFSTNYFDVRIGDSVLTPGRLAGGGESEGGRVSWDLSYKSSHPPVFLQSRQAYSLKFPKAKSLIAHPLAVFHGVLTVAGREIPIEDWVGSQNHNWGTAHTDKYAFAQVAGFDDDPEGFLEIATAQVKVAGPLHTPWATMLVLRAHGREYDMSSLLRAIRHQAKYSYFEWTFTAENDQARISGRISAPREAFVGLVYYNPPGGVKHCLNTKIGRCELEVFDKSDGRRFSLNTAHRALFEILTDDRHHGIRIRA